jgi:hypothetical protein
VKLTDRSSLATTAARVAEALARAGIRTVLTGGACAALYSGGKYQSFDLDFILQSSVTARELDKAMGTIGFRRVGSHYQHPRVRFLVEFPAGPLGIGSDLDIRPVLYRIGKSALRALSPTDSCRDRLAAFYHWNDRQSLAAAIEIGLRRRVNVEAMREWSARQGATAKYQTFLQGLARARKRGRGSRSGGM